jgi:N-acetylmuramic acid 6-phosphate etherase
MNDDDRQVAESIQQQLPRIEDAVIRIAEALSAGGRLFYLGAGTSGRLGVLDASECPPTFGTDPELVTGIIAGGDPALRRSSEGIEDAPEQGWLDLEAAGAGPGDVLVGITASTRTPYVVGALRRAREEGLVTVFLTCNPASVDDIDSDVTIQPVLGPEIVAGSTRLKAGTATKMILNMLSTAVFVRLGRSYGNLMVDIRPVSDKLRARARRIVMLAAGTSFDAADGALRSAGEEVRTAIVMLRAGLEAPEARTLLESTGGDLRKALGGDGPASIGGGEDA